MQNLEGVNVSYVNKNLMTGEKIIFTTKLNLPHLLILPSFFISTGFFLILSDNAIGSLSLLFGIGFAVTRLIEFASSEFAVTNKRLFLKSGLLRRKTAELLLRKIEGLNLNQGIIDRILSSGSISVSGTGGKPVTFSKINRPNKLRKHVNEQIDAAESQNSKQAI